MGLGPSPSKSQVLMSSRHTVADSKPRGAWLRPMQNKKQPRIRKSTEVGGKKSMRREGARWWTLVLLQRIPSKKCALRAKGAQGGEVGQESVDLKPGEKQPCGSATPHSVPPGCVQLLLGH